MRKLRVGRRIIPLLFLFILILALWLPLKIVPAGYTWIDLTGGDGRPMLSAVLPAGKTLVFSWRTSLFGLQVNEIFSARCGVLVLSSVTFSHPGLPVPPRVPASEVSA